MFITQRKNVPSVKLVLMRTALQKYLAPSQFGSKKATRICKVRMPLCHTPHIFICEGRNQTRPLEYRIISYIYNTDCLGVLYKCSSDAGFPLSGKQIQVWCQLAPLNTSMGCHRLIHGTMYPHQPDDLGNLQSPFLILSLQIYKSCIFKYTLNNLSH